MQFGRSHHRPHVQIVGAKFVIRTDSLHHLEDFANLLAVLRGRPDFLSCLIKHRLPLGGKAPPGPNELDAVSTPRLRCDLDLQPLGRRDHRLQRDTGRTVELPLFKAGDQRGGSQLAGQDHHPPAPGFRRLPLAVVVVVPVIGRQPIHHRQSQFGQTLRQDHIPQPLCSRMLAIPAIVHAGMPVVDLEKVLPPHSHQVFGPHRVAEVRVVEVNQHWLPRPLPLGHQGVGVPLQHFVDAVASQRGQHLFKVGRVHVQRQPAVPVRDLFPRDQQEFSRPRDLGADLRERLQPDFQPALRAFAFFDPVTGKRGLQLLIRLFPAGAFLHVDPLVTHLQGVVVGVRQKVVPLIAIPLRHHLGVVVSVTPERVGMQIAPKELQTAFSGQHSAGSSRSRALGGGPHHSRQQGDNRSTDSQPAHNQGLRHDPTVRGWCGSDACPPVLLTIPSPSQREKQTCRAQKSRTGPPTPTNCREPQGSSKHFWP